MAEEEKATEEVMMKLGRMGGRSRMMSGFFLNGRESKGFDCQSRGPSVCIRFLSSETLRIQITHGVFLQLENQFDAF